MTVSVQVCEPAAAQVAEAAWALQLVRSANVFAAGWCKDGLLVRYCNNRSPGVLYLYDRAPKSALAQLLSAQSAHHFVANLALQFPYRILAGNLTHPLLETWDYCSRCDSLFGDEIWLDDSPDGPMCFSCQVIVARYFSLDRCASCSTYVASVDDRALGRRCASFQRFEL